MCVAKRLLHLDCLLRTPLRVTWAVSRLPCPTTACTTANSPTLKACNLTARRVTLCRKVSRLAISTAELLRGGLRLRLGPPFAPFTTGVLPPTASLAATQTRTRPTSTQQATAQSASPQGARQGAPTAEAGASNQQGGQPGGNDGNGNDQGNGNGGNGRDPP